MRRIFFLLFILFTLPTLAHGQAGASAASPTLKVSDGTKSFNGVNELRFPVGCVTFSNRTAVITCSSGGTSSGTTSSQNGNLFYASPNGSYGLPSWRAIVSADIPALDAAKITTGTMATARLGSGTASSSTYLRGDQTWATLPASGTVSSVALSLPSEITVSGSPVTSTGTLAGAWANQTTNKVFAAPDGSTGTPTFRTLVEADIPTLSQSKITNLVSDLAAKQSLDSDLTAIAGLTATTDSFMQAKGSAWAARTVAQVKTDLGLTGTNSGDQTSIVGITGTTAQFNTALTDGDFATLAGTETLTNKTLTTPTIANFTNATHGHTSTATGGNLNASVLVAGTVGTARLGSGTAASSTYLRGDQTWATPVTTILGTTDQVMASASTGAVTLSLPQSIATTSSPTFTALSLGAGTTGPRTSLTDPNNVPSYSQLFFYPATGTNAGQSFSVIPRGTGYNSTNKAQFNLFNTDGIADASNNEWAGFRAVGTSGFIIGTGKAGTGSNRALMFATGWFSDGTTNDGQLYLATDGSVGINTTAPTAKLDINSDTLRLRNAKTPASASAACNAGDFAWDGSFFYLCIATNTWHRSAHATW